MDSKVYAQISEQQKQTLLDTKLNSVIGMDSNNIGRLVNEAQRIVFKNELRYRQRDTNDISRQVEDTSKMDGLIAEGEKLIEDIKTKLKILNANEIYIQKMKRLGDKYDSEKRVIENSIDGVVARVHTNNRRVEYQEPELQRIGTIRTILIIIFYIILICYLLKNQFVQKIMDRDFRFITLLILYTFLPFFIDTIVAQSVLLWEKVLYLYDNSIPRNIYVNL